LEQFDKTGKEYEFYVHCLDLKCDKNQMSSRKLLIFRNPFKKILQYFRNIRSALTPLRCYEVAAHTFRPADAKSLHSK